MAEVKFLQYSFQQSAIHEADSRFKLIALILFSIVIGIAAKPIILFIFTITLLVFIAIAKLPPKHLVMELKRFLPFIALIVLFHALYTPGLPIIHLPMFRLTWAGILSGMVYGWRLVLIVFLCTLLSSTTTPASLKSAVEWFLRPIPGIPAARVGTMFGLIFVLLPLLFDQVANILDAQKARCIERQKNPLKRVIALGLPFLVNTLNQADEMILAMESRCYSEYRTPSVLTAKRSDWIMLSICVLVTSIIFFQPLLP
jgi:biotin transport system permease protein